MNTELKILLVYLIFISFISAVVCIADKISAIKGKRRVSEKSLFTLCFLGGSVAMYITMRLIRHKTLHKRFMIGIPLIILLQAGLCIALIFLSR